MAKKDNRETMKTSKIAGSINLPVGVNLANAIFDDGSSVGIPPYELEKVAKIVKEFLDDDEYQYLCLSFGLGCERMLNKDIAKKFGMDQNAYSKRLRRAIEKLQRPECRNRIAKLIPTRDDVYAAFIVAKKRSVADGRVQQLEGEVTSLKNEITRLKDSLKVEKEKKPRVPLDMSAQMKQLSDETAKAKGELASTREENGALKKQAEVAEKKSAESDKNLQLQKEKAERAEKRLADSNRKVEFLEGNLRLTTKASAEKDKTIQELTSRAEIAEAQASEYKALLDTVLNTTIGELIGSQNKQTIDSECGSDTADDEASCNDDHPEPTLKTVFDGISHLLDSLRRAGITDLGELLSKSPHDLAKLGVSKKHIAKIKKQLLNHGLHLRGCSAA